MRRSSFGLLAGIVLFLLVAGSAGAVPAPPGPIQLENEDGSYIWGRMYGDEYLSWTEDLDGYALAFEPATGEWHFAELNEVGRLVPGPYSVGSVDPQALGLEKHLAPSKRVKAETLALRARYAYRQPGRSPRLAGNVKNLVILVKFANDTTTHPATTFQNIFNGASGSFKDYYDEVSYGQVNMQSVVVGWLTLPQNDSYYAWNGSYQNGDPSAMVSHAIDILDAQNFDFSQVDGDNDGYVDAIDIIHSGEGYETSGYTYDIHSHFAPLYYAITTHDGKHINAYHTEPELQGDGYSPTQIGVVCHETAHFFGLPDLYDYDYDSGGIGMWGLMASGPWAGPNSDGTVPTHPSAWSKWALDFNSPTHVQSSTYGIVLRPAQAYQDAVIVNEGMSSNEFFIMEDRQKTGYDAYLPGAGLLIYHIDQTQSDNNNQNRYLVDVEQADGLRELNTSYYEQGDNADPWPYGSKNAFTPTSTPNTKAYNASSSDISILNITRSGSNINLDVDLGGTPVSSLALNPSSLSFSGSAGGANPTAKTFSVNHQGVSSLSFSATSLTGWVTVNPSSGTTPATLTVSVNTAGLSAGSHSGSIRITSPSASNSPQLLTVNLTLTDSPPVIQLSPGSSMQFFGEVGGANPLGQDLTVSNSGGGALNWSAMADVNWLWLSSYSGSAPATVTITPNIYGLPAGQHQATIRFSAPGAADVWQDVTLTLSQRGNLEASPQNMSFSSVGGSNPSPQGLSIADSTGGGFNVTVNCQPAWLQCSQNAIITPAQVAVSINAFGLADGQYTGSITLSSTTADNSPLTIGVQLRVSPTNSPPSTPTLISPAALAEVRDPNPELTLQNASDPDGDALTYEFEVYPVQSDQAYFTATGVNEGIGFTSLRITKTLDFQATYRWRARATDSYGASSAWTEFTMFSVVKSQKTGCATASGSDLSALFVLLAGVWALRRRRL